MFTGDNVKQLLDSGKVNGILVANGENLGQADLPQDGFSADQTCPNRESDYYKGDSQYSCDKKPVNPTGTGLMMRDLDIPVMVLNKQDEIDRVLQCYEENNFQLTTAAVPEYPLCAAELVAYMFGAGNTEICLRRNDIQQSLTFTSYCGFLGGRSSHAFLNRKLNHETRADNSVIALVARIDSFSLFEYMQPGTSTPAPAIATIMAIADALKPYRRAFEDANKEVMFLLLTGESFDYIGSEKFVYDMDKGFVPNKTEHARLEMKHFDIIVELSQFLHAVDTKTIYVHKDPKTHADHSSIEKLIGKLNESAINITIMKSDDHVPLPPSSSQTFLKKQSVAAVVLADHDLTYKTKYYHSYLDTPSTAQIDYPLMNETYTTDTKQSEFLTEIASLVATSVYRYATDNGTASITADKAIPREILSCLLVSPSCDLFLKVVSPTNYEIINTHRNPFPFYVGVYSRGTIDNIQYIMLQLLAHYTGDVITTIDNESDCTDQADSFWMMGPLVNDTRKNVCVRSSAQFHNATSPAMEVENYDFTSGQYPTWTESVWGATGAFGVRIFLVPDSSTQLIHLLSGLAVIITSFVVVFFVHRKSDSLFPPHQDNLIVMNSAQNS